MTVIHHHFEEEHGLTTEDSIRSIGDVSMYRTIDSVNDDIPPITTPSSISTPIKNDTATSGTVIAAAQDERQSIFTTARSKALRPFVIISTSYLLFTVTDGAIRLIVLLHAYNQGFSSLQVAIMFTFYEGAGVITNVCAGMMGARWGIKYTLISGLVLQLFSYGLLFGWKEDWSQSTAIIYVTMAQMFAGIAKDLTKLGGKTVTKLVTPEEKDTQLFKLVSLLTGWKNSLKGVGYFVGSALLQISYETALLSMMGLILLALPWAITGLDHNLGTAKSKNSGLHEIFNLNNPNLNWLSIARLFLFASRDFWFEVPLPFFLRSPACEGLGIDTCVADSDCTTGAICGIESQLCENINTGGGCGGLGASRVIVGAALGGYILLYGQIQSWTPQLVTGPLKQSPPNKLTEILWGTINCIPTLVAALVLQLSPSFEENDVQTMTIWLVIIIVSFAIIFAINSSIHSYLVVKYAEKDKVAVSVGLYYMSNAFGRLIGTIGSGLLYTYVGETYNEYSGTNSVLGLAACMYASTSSSIIAVLLTLKINDDQAGLACGPCLSFVNPTIVETFDGETDSIMLKVPIILERIEL
jgi:Major Facilitator Superfamily